MRAAVVSSFGHPPRWQELPTPTPADEHEMLVDVVASALHPRVRSQADGSHYTSTGDLPMVPGVDGVGRGPDGKLRYFLLPDTTMGAIAEQTVIDTRRSVLLSPDCDPVRVAAGMNPAMSSWVALRQRIELPKDGSALVLGATGSSGRMAVQILHLFGARRIVAAGRDADRLGRLKTLGATDLVRLTGDADGDADALGAAAADVDVVLDYVWGPPTAAAMIAVVTQRADRSIPLTWVEIGSTAGPTAEIPSAALRAARLDIVGSGQGSVSTREYLAELPELAAQISAGAFDLAVRTVPFADVEPTWTEPATGSERVVFVPAR